MPKELLKLFRVSASLSRVSRIQDFFLLHFFLSLFSGLFDRSLGHSNIDLRLWILTETCFFFHLCINEFGNIYHTGWLWKIWCTLVTAQFYPYIIWQKNKKSQTVFDILTEFEILKKVYFFLNVVDKFYKCWSLLDMILR